MTVMLVEDEPILLLLLKKFMKSLDCRVSAAVMSGEEAVEAARNTIPDVIIMDIRLKGAMDGITAALTINSGIPVIFTTAYGDDEIRKRAASCSMAAFINKPYGIEEIRAALEAANTG